MRLGDFSCLFHLGFHFSSIMEKEIKGQTPAEGWLQSLGGNMIRHRKKVRLKLNLHSSVFLQDQEMLGGLTKVSHYCVKGFVFF